MFFKEYEICVHLEKNEKYYSGFLKGKFFKTSLLKCIKLQDSNALLIK